MEYNKYFISHKRWRCKMIGKDRLERFIWTLDDLVFEGEEGQSPELGINPRENKLLRDKILNKQEEVWQVYIQAYDKSKEGGSALPHTKAMIAVRELFTETPTGWVRKEK
jgi:hypothetical protein